MVGGKTLGSGLPKVFELSALPGFCYSPQLFRGNVFARVDIPAEEVLYFMRIRDIRKVLGRGNNVRGFTLPSFSGRYEMDTENYEYSA